jgi:OmpA-OmpF porin, OOP family
MIYTDKIWGIRFGHIPKRLQEEKMKKLLQLLVITGIAISSSAFAQKANDNWVNSTGVVWKNGTNELCWRDANWTPATAAPGCDGALAGTTAPTSAKVTFNADALFDFDKSVLKPDAKASLDSLLGKIKSLTLEVIIAVGHTDAIGTEAYNQKLSVRRANAVKKYLVSKGIEPNRIYVEGKGKTQPVADNKTAEGRAKNRRVEIEVVGTRAN